MSNKIRAGTLAQISVARGRIARDRNLLERASHPATCADLKERIERELAFICQARNQVAA